MRDKNLHENTPRPLYIDYKDENPDALQSPNEPKDLEKKRASSPTGSETGPWSKRPFGGNCEVGNLSFISGEVCMHACVALLHA